VTDNHPGIKKKQKKRHCCQRRRFFHYLPYLPMIFGKMYLKLLQRFSGLRMLFQDILPANGCKNGCNEQQGKQKGVRLAV
jgi:hypothetical protein